MVLIVLLFPALALGGEVKYEDLVKTDGLHYKKFTDIPFTGKTTGKIQGSFRNGKEHGPWVIYHENGRISYKGTYKNAKKDGPWVSYWNDGQLKWKGTYKDGERDGPWVGYNKDGTVDEEETGTFKDGMKIFD